MPNFVYSANQDECVSFSHVDAVKAFELAASNPAISIYPAEGARIGCMVTDLMLDDKYDTSMHFVGRAFDSKTLLLRVRMLKAALDEYNRFMSEQDS